MVFPQRKDHCILGDAYLRRSTKLPRRYHSPHELLEFILFVFLSFTARQGMFTASVWVPVVFVKLFYPGVAAFSLHCAEWVSLSFFSSSLI